MKSWYTSGTGGGRINRSDAFEMAIQLFHPFLTNKQVVVMLTDGVTTADEYANATAADARAKGIATDQVQFRKHGKDTVIG